MHSENSKSWSISTLLAGLLTIPLVMMGVVMPLVAITKGGKMIGSAGGVKMLLPLIPLVLIGTLAYALYTYTGVSEDRRQESKSPLEQLQSAYARGELSDAEFEERRARLQSQHNASDRTEGSRHE